YKYLPSYQYYQKSSLLYNYPTVKKNRTEECYLVEGFFDVISLHKLGVENCLALLGTNLSEAQTKLLIELKKRIILFLDSDKAGQEATVNAAVKLLLKEVDCEVIKSNYEGDPDEICQQQNKEKVGNNPQRISRFVSEIAEVFRKFKPSIYDFLIAKISSLVELVEAAKPVVTIFSAINSLEKKIKEKERNIKNKKAVAEDIKKLKIELKKKEKELKKMGEKKVIEGGKATRFLLHYNKHFVQYLAKGYSSFNRKIDPEELVSEGISSLPKAIENQFINQGSENKEKKNVVYYDDSSYRNDDKESKSYSLLETLHDEENVELTAEQIRHRDTVIQTNNLINTLEDREAILLIRLLSGVKPTNLLDIYYLANEEEKGELKKKMKLGNKFNSEVALTYGTPTGQFTAHEIHKANGVDYNPYCEILIKTPVVVLNLTAKYLRALLVALRRAMSLTFGLSIKKLPWKQRQKKSDLLATNLVLVTENNRVCDFFPTQHLIIPLTNSESKIVAFAARKIGEIPTGEGKYKYLP
ncbi:3827_t:CDS:2, partial [Funneliformis geosporum]